MPSTNGSGPENSTEARSGTVEIHVSGEVAAALTLYALLKAFRRELKTNADTEWETPQLQMADAQSSAIKFLQAAMCLLPEGDLKLLDPLDKIRVVMSEISLGWKPRLLFDALRLEDLGAKRPPFTLVHQAQGTLAAAYGALRPPCPGGTKAEMATQWLNKALQDREMHAMVSAKDIEGWYYQAKAKSGAQLLVKAFDSFQPHLRGLLDRAEAEAFAKQQLDGVRGMLLPRLKLRRAGSTRKIGKNLTTSNYSKENG